MCRGDPAVQTRKEQVVMKRFISALSSLVIAATAMSGTFAISTDAAVDKTIIDFTTVDASGKRVNTIEASAGDKIPLTIYVPQCAGLNTLALKLAVNGDATLGEGTVQYPELDYTAADGSKGMYYETEEGKKHIGDAGKVAKNEYLWSNYGITLTDAKFAEPYCFDSGYLEGNGYGDANKAGKASNGTAIFKGEAWNLNWMSNKAVQQNPKGDIDAYGAWVAAGKPADLTDPDEDDPVWLYTPVKTWDTSAAWAYDYALATATVNLPANLANGTYEINLYKGTYMNSNSIFDTDYKRDEDGKIIEPKTLIYKPTQTNYSVSGSMGAANFEIKPLVIKVGVTGDDTTTTTSTTTSSSTSSDTTKSNVGSDSSVTVPADTILYQFVKDGGSWADTVNVQPGEKVKFNLTVSNDQGTAGASLYLRFDEKLALAKRATAGNAYEASFEWNADDRALVWTCTEGHDQKAKDGAVIYSFTVTVPEDAKKGDSFEIGLNTDSLPDGKSNSVRPQGSVTEYPDHKFMLQSVKLVVGGSDTTEPGTTTTVTDPTTTSSSSTTSDTTTSSSSSTTETTTTVGEAVWGDVNCNGTVSIADVVLLNKYIAGNAVPTAQGLINADVTHDNTPDGLDAVKIKAYLALIDGVDLAAPGAYTAK